MKIAEYKIEFDENIKNKDDIRKCLNTLYSIREGTMPLDRNFGLNCEAEGMPQDVAENTLTVEIMEKTEIYEKRVEVEEVEFKKTTDGEITVIVKVVAADTEEGDKEDGD